MHAGVMTGMPAAEHAVATASKSSMLPGTRGLHPSTFRLHVCTCGERIWGFQQISVTETAQVELSEYKEAPGVRPGPRWVGLGRPAPVYRAAEHARAVVVGANKVGGLAGGQGHGGVPPVAAVLGLLCGLVLGAYTRPLLGLSEQFINSGGSVTRETNKLGSKRMLDPA